MNDERGIEKDKGNGVLPCVSGSFCTECKTIEDLVIVKVEESNWFPENCMY